MRASPAYRRTMNHTMRIDGPMARWPRMPRSLCSPGRSQGSSSSARSTRCAIFSKCTYRCALARNRHSSQALLHVNAVFSSISVGEWPSPTAARRKELLPATCPPEYDAFTTTNKLDRNTAVSPCAAPRFKSAPRLVPLTNFSRDPLKDEYADMPIYAQLLGN